MNKKKLQKKRGMIKEIIKEAILEHENKKNGIGVQKVEKTKIVNSMSNGLDIEMGYEYERGKNFENKAYIGLVAVTFLISKNFSINFKNISWVTFIGVLYYICLCTSIYFLLKVIQTRKVERPDSEDFYSSSTLKDEDSFLNYQVGINDEKITIIKESEIVLKEVSENFDKGLAFLKISLIFYLLLIFITGSQNRFEEETQNITKPVNERNVKENEETKSEGFIKNIENRIKSVNKEIQEEIKRQKRIFLKKISNFFEDLYYNFFYKKNIE